MSESVEQAATTEGWKQRATREAAAILHEADVWRIADRGELIGLMAIAWLQGASFGAHDTLAHVDEAFERMRAKL